MARITNSPNETLQFDLERRKSFAFRLVLLTEDEQPVDLTGCRVRFVLKQESWDDDQYDLTNLVVNQFGAIPEGAEAKKGYAVFSFQAAELDRDPGSYFGAIVLWTSAGYSTTLVKISVHLAENTESDSMHLTYTASAPPSVVELTLRGENVVNVHTQNVSLASIQRAPGMRTTATALNVTPGQTTSVPTTAIDPQTYQAGGSVELMVGDIVVQSGTISPVLGRILSVGTNTIQVLTLVGPGGD